MGAGRESCYSQLEDRGQDAAYRSTMHRKGPTTKHFLSQNLSSAKALLHSYTKPCANYVVTLDNVQEAGLRNGEKQTPGDTARILD